MSAAPTMQKLDMSKATLMSRWRDVKRARA
jgi:hypothetical protein